MEDAACNITTYFRWDFANFLFNMSEMTASTVARKAYILPEALFSKLQQLAALKRPKF